MPIFIFQHLTAPVASPIHILLYATQSHLFLSHFLQARDWPLRYSSYLTLNMASFLMSVKTLRYSLMSLRITFRSEFSFKRIYFLFNLSNTLKLHECSDVLFQVKIHFLLPTCNCTAGTFITFCWYFFIFQHRFTKQSKNYTNVCLQETRLYINTYSSPLLRYIPSDMPQPVRLCNILECEGPQ